MSRTYRNGNNQAATVVMVVADITAVILGLWILFDLLDANPANDLVAVVRDAAGWLAGWSHDLFTFDTAGCGRSLTTVWPRWSTCSSATPWRAASAAAEARPLSHFR